MSEKTNPIIMAKFREALAKKGYSVKSERGFALAIDSLTDDSKSS